MLRFTRNLNTVKLYSIVELFIKVGVIILEFLSSLFIIEAKESLKVLMCLTVKKKKN